MRWAEGLGPVVCAGVEGTSTGLARHLSRAGIKVLEVERPKRRHLGRNGTDDVVGFLGEATSPEGGKLGHKPWALSASW